MSDGVQPRGRTRMAGHEDEASLFRARGGPLEVVLGTDRLIVFINTDQRHVDIETREIEVVRIAAEESGLKLRHEHQTHVGVFLVAIEIVLTALVKRHNVGTQSGGDRKSTRLNS